MLKTAVVILNWNGKKFLEQFLPSVNKYTLPPDAQIYVADNGSTDDSLSFLKEKYPSIKTILLDKNYGFTGGYNRALQKIEAQYYVLLNSDVEVTENWLEPIINLMDENNKIAATMPKILDYKRKNYFEYAGAAGGFIDKWGYPFCRGRIISCIEKDEGQYNEMTEIFWATGACMFVRADLFHKLGGLDNDFFAHMEEIDLCWRMKNQGYKIMYVPQSKIYHFGGGTLPNNNPQKLFLNYRNNLFLILKNEQKGKVFATLFVRMLLDGVSAIMYILQAKPKCFVAVIKAHFAFYKGFAKMKTKRKQNNHDRCSTINIGVYKRSIVFDFFVKKRKIFSNLH